MDVMNEPKEQYNEMDRVISKRVEEAYRLVAGEFSGLTMTEAAKKMGVSRPRISQILAALEVKAPQLFPLITKVEFETLSLLRAGVPTGKIGSLLGVPKSTVDRRITNLIKKRRWSAFRSRTVAYSPKMDETTVRKF